MHNLTNKERGFLEAIESAEHATLLDAFDHVYSYPRWSAPARAKRALAVIESKLMGLLKDRGRVDSALFKRQLTLLKRAAVRQDVDAGRTKGRGGYGGPLPLATVEVYGSYRHAFSEETAARVETAVAWGVPLRDLAAYLGLGENTIRRHYGDFIARGRVASNMRVTSFLFEFASGEALETIQGATPRDCISAAQFWLRYRAGWNDLPADLGRPGRGPWAPVDDDDGG